MYKILAEDKEARFGQLKTLHGTVKTPCFMPVATKTAIKFLTMEQAKEVNVQAVISNAFILSLNPGLEVIQAAGGLHKYEGWGGTIFTDCGGFQVSRESLILRKTESGILFKNPFNGQRVMCSPDYIMRFMQGVGCDVMMALDDMPLCGATKEEAMQSIKNTHKWQQKCKKLHTTNQLLFGICQGSIYSELREESAKFINSLDFDGNAIGGLAIGESKEDMYKMIDSAVPHLNPDKPRYLMGVGSPAELIRCIEKGVDIFDSVYPTQNARHDNMFTSQGVIRIDQAKYKDDKGPIDPECDCAVCKNHTRSQIYYLGKIGEPTAKIYKTYHNIAYLQKLMGQAREAIKEEEFVAFSNAVLKKY